MDRPQFSDSIKESSRDRCPAYRIAARARYLGAYDSRASERAQVRGLGCLEAGGRRPAAHHIRRPGSGGRNGAAQRRIAIDKPPAKKHRSSLSWRLSNDKKEMDRLRLPPGRKLPLAAPPDYSHLPGSSAMARCLTAA